MAAENIIGELLEMYIDNMSRVTSAGWCRAYGDVVKGVDFVKSSPSGWILLQIKNRDNSENSSSSAIRSGTNIIKWFRTFSRTGNTNWSNFPDDMLKSQMSENGFRIFVQDYMASLKL